MAFVIGSYYYDINMFAICSGCKDVFFLNLYFAAVEAIYLNLILQKKTCSKHLHL